MIALGMQDPQTTLTEGVGYFGDWRFHFHKTVTSYHLVPALQT